MSLSTSSEETLVLNFISAFEKLNAEKMRILLDDAFIMYVTNAAGGVDKIEGAEQFIDRFKSIDYSKASYLNLTATQLVTIEPNKIMAMVHVKANKKDVDFENFAAFLFYISSNKIIHIWMVDAKPAYSDHFWKG